VKDSNPSGKTEEDIRNDAMHLYLEQHGEPFKFLHCLDELWKLPKFQPNEEVIEIGSDDEEPALVQQSEDGANNTLNVMGGDLACPMGTKAAKQQLKEDRSVASTMAGLVFMRTQSMAKMVKVHSDKAQSLKDRVKLK
jgi:hypothetical protein